MDARRLLKRISIVLAITLAAAIAAGAIWLGSSHALKWAAEEVVRSSDGTVVLSGVEGTLLGEVRVGKVTFTGTEFTFEAESVAVHWRPLALLGGEIRLRHAAAASLRYRSLAAAPSQLPQSLALPLPFTIEALEIRKLDVDGMPAIRNLRLALAGGRSAHEITLLQTEAADWRLGGKLRIATVSPFALEGRLQARRGGAPENPQATATIGGDLESVQITAQAAGLGATLNAEALIRPYAPQPIAKAGVQLRELDLSAWNKALPETRLSADVLAQSEAGTLTGSLAASNSAAGTLDAGRLPVTAASIRYSGAGRIWALRDIDLRLAGGGQTLGRGELREGVLSLSLSLDDIDPSRLDRRLLASKVSGTAQLSGNRLRQDGRARLEGAGLKLQIAGRHADAVLHIEDARVQAGSGMAELSGQLRLSGPYAFAAQGTLNRFDPSKLATLPQALLNGRFEVSGNLQPQWLAKVQVELTDSRLRGLPLNGGARFTTSAARLFDGSARAAISRNRMEISGRYGRAQDRLQWNVLAEDLRAIDPALGGRLAGQGAITGATDGAAADFKIDAEQLVFREHRAMRFAAEGSFATGRDDPLRFSADAAGLQVARTRIDTLTLRANGTRARHRLEGAAQGSGSRSALRASGGLDAQGRWNGTLDQLEISEPWPLRLSSPATLTVGRDLLVVEQLRASLLDGQLGPATLRVEQGRIRTQGEFHGASITRLLPRDSGIDARSLRLGGLWSLTLDETWNGTASVYRESGDVALALEKPLALALQKARLRMTAAAGTLDLGIDLDSKTMGTAAAQVQARIARRDGRWVLPGDSPLSGNASLNLHSLAWLRALLPGADRIDGRFAAQGRIEGTVAAPRFAGTMTGDQLMLRALGPGIDLRDGRLRATLGGTQLRLEEMELKAGKGRITASGVAELNGGLHSVDLRARAESAQILLTPQWSAIIDGGGQLGFRDGQLTLAGKFDLAEGLYDPGTQRKPALGDDVLVRTTREAPARKAAAVPVRLDVSLNLNDRLTVRGNGLDALLGGAIRITTRGDTLAAVGDVRTVRGYYSAFGQKLEITRGNLAFAGPLTNPGLDLRAVRQIQTVEVGVEVTGSLQRPSVRLVSIPDMSDTYRLGWLTLGRNPQNADSAQLAVLQAAALSLVSGGGKPLTGQVAEGVGLDELGFAGGEGETLGVITLGKRLTDRLSIRLEQTLGGTAGSLLRMDYILSERWRLRGTAGAENAGDILFTWRFD
jgi:translocation and assembly module TamB